MREGLSLESFAGLEQVGVCEDTIHEWKNTFPEFSEAYKKGKSAKLLFYETRAIEAAFDPIGKPVNTGLLCFLMKNQIGWKDKVEHSSDATSPPVIQLKYKIEEKK